MKKCEANYKIVLSKRSIGPAKKFETKLKKMNNLKIVFVRKVIGPVKKFDAKMKKSIAHHELVFF